MQKRAAVASSAVWIHAVFESRLYGRRVGRFYCGDDNRLYPIVIITISPKSEKCPEIYSLLCRSNGQLSSPRKFQLYIAFLIRQISNHLGLIQ